VDCDRARHDLDHRLLTQRALLPEVIALEIKRLYLECGLPLERLHTAALGSKPDVMGPAKTAPKPHPPNRCSA
jgi:hypothetical protein